MKKTVVIEVTVSAEEAKLFLKESRKATGVHVEVGRPSRKAKVYGFGDVEDVPSTVYSIASDFSSDFKVSVKE